MFYLNLVIKSCIWFSFLMYMTSCKGIIFYFGLGSVSVANSNDYSNSDCGEIMRVAFKLIMTNKSVRVCSYVVTAQ